jgi:hypothetical protein
MSKSMEKTPPETQHKETQQEREHEVKSENDNMDQYLKQFTPLENDAFIIAKRQLKSSFDLEKSIGYLNYKK